MYTFVLRIHAQISFPASIFFLEVVVLQAGAFLLLVLKVVIYKMNINSYILNDGLLEGVL